MYISCMEKKQSLEYIKTPNPAVINLQQGKIPPQALELEEAVLGAMLIDKKGVDEVIDILQPDAFYKTSHQLIFEAIYQTFSRLSTHRFIDGFFRA